jgi:hypothetical protein
MSASAPGFDPLIAEANLRMRRRRVVIAGLALLAGAAVMFLIFRPSGAPGTSHLTSGGRNSTPFRQIVVPVDSAERTWRAGTESMIRNSQTASGLTRTAVIRLHREVVSAAQKTGATVVRIKVWPRFGAVELVIATAMNPAEYLVHHLPRLVSLLEHGDPYVKVVNSRGSRIFEWYYLSGSGMVGYAKGLDQCGPVYHGEPVILGGGPPPCPVK